MYSIECYFRHFINNVFERRRNKFKQIIIQDSKHNNKATAVDLTVENDISLPRIYADQCVYDGKMISIALTGY